MNRGGFSWKRVIGVTRVNSGISRAVGVPLTKSGRQRKVGRIVTGGGCLLPVLCVPAALLLAMSLIAVAGCTAASAPTSSGVVNAPATTVPTQSVDPLDRLLPGDIILKANAPDPFFDHQRDTYGAHFTHAMIYVGVRDGKHMVVEATAPGYVSQISPLESKTFGTYQIVRVKDASDTDRAAVARVAEKVLVGIPYGWGKGAGLVAIRAGLDKKRMDRMVCSSLVWNAWMGAAKVDLDSDYVDTVGTLSSVLMMPKPYYVMPDDIAMSDKVSYVVDIPLPPKPEPVEVPNVKGKTEAAARKLLEAAGFKVKVARRHSSAKKGIVTAQKPSSGKADLGSTVTITVSLGVEMVVVPDVFKIMHRYPGLDIFTSLSKIERFINKQLASRGLRVHVLAGSDVPGGSGQWPRAGKRVPRGTRITMKVLD